MKTDDLKPQVKVAVSDDADFLHQFLAGRDAECPLCGYNLRDLVGDRCPECGDQLQLRVNTVEPKQAAAIAGLIGLSAGAGLNGLLILYGIALLALHGWDGGWLRFLVVNLTGLAVEGGALLLWLKCWRSIRRSDARRRRMLATACWLLTLANLVAFTILIR